MSTVCICALYGYNGENINEARYSLFCAKAVESSQLLPTKDALELYIKRANYQAGIWRRALEAQPNIPPPQGHGSIADQDKEVNIQRTTKPPAPLDIMKLVSCGCKTGCNSGRCSCRKSDLPCTEVCQCASTVRT